MRPLAKDNSCELRNWINTAVPGWQFLTELPDRHFSFEPYRWKSSRNPGNFLDIALSKEIMTTVAFEERVLKDMEGSAASKNCDRVLPGWDATARFTNR